MAEPNPPMVTGTSSESVATAAPSATSFAAFLETVKDQPVYVILGVQGSGTNLLRSLLDRTFNFSVVQDQALVYNAARQLGVRPSQADVRSAFEALRKRLLPSTVTRKTSRRIKTNGSFEGIDGHFGALHITSGTDLAYFVYAYSAFSRNTRLMAIKSDDLWETIAGLDQVLPNRRIVLLTRDFRDNLLSISRKGFGPVEPLMAALYVKERFAHYDAEFQRTPEAHRLHVRYEDLLEAPDAFVTKFCTHFGLAARGHVPPPVDTGRIRRNNVRKWTALSARELAYCEGILREELQRYGYPVESDAPALPGRLTWYLAKGQDTVRRIPQKIRNYAARLRK